MHLRPVRCPYRTCTASRPRARFVWRRRGHYVRRCDGRRVQRFECLTCRRRFSSQSFRLDFRLRRPWLTYALWPHFVSKVTHRQSARLLRTSRKTVAHRLVLLGRHCRELHHRLLRVARLSGEFQLAELRTYETDRHSSPVTFAVLIQGSSRLIVDGRAAPLRARRNHKDDSDARPSIPRRVRRDESRRAILGCLAVLAKRRAPGAFVKVRTGPKSSYKRLIPAVLRERCVHIAEGGCDRRSSRGLVSVRHTLALMRDGLSRLVQRTWAASKRRGRLVWHAWIWIAWRNYIRGVTNRLPRTTPAMLARLAAEPIPLARWLRSAARFSALTQRNGA